MKARVTVYPRPDILDPQGKAIRQSLERIGFDRIEDVRAGKSFEISLEVGEVDQARRVLREMCEKLLANPVVETYEVEILGEAPTS